jgi:hypothetical protein
MTRISGHNLIASPCCKSIYKTPVYASLNMSAMGYWTDGAQEHGLSSIDGGLRLCQCGAAFLLQDAVRVGIEAGSGIAFADKPLDPQLPAIIQNPSSVAVEVTARRNHWRYLNDNYRAQYRMLRETQDAIGHEQWRRDYYASLPLLERVLRKLVRSEPKQDFPSAEQVENMTKLLALILAGGDAPFKANALEIAELHRELGEFGAATKVLHQYNEDDQEVMKQMISKRIAERCSAPVRFRM